MVLPPPPLPRTQAERRSSLTHKQTHQRRAQAQAILPTFAASVCIASSAQVASHVSRARVTVKKIAPFDEGVHALPIGHAPNAVASLLSTNVAAQEMLNAPATKVSKVFDRELPNVPGKSMRAVLVEYGPGAASPSHRHPSSAFIYATVLEGEIRSKVNDEPEHVYKAGESWTEMPGDHHQVSANASSTKPARLLAIFVVDTTEQELVIPDK